MSRKEDICLDSKREPDKFLQEVYFEMDERDGVRGAINIHNTQPNSDTEVKLLELQGSYQVT